jgi:hypothetical protein
MLLEHEEICKLLSHITFEIISDKDLRARLKRIGLNF